MWSDWAEEGAAQSGLKGVDVAGNYRYWCGECRYQTPWLSESQGEAAHELHYAQRHPGIMPGGRVEVKESKGEGCGCVLLVGVLFVFFLVVATCQGSTGHTTSGMQSVSWESR